MNMTLVRVSIYIDSADDSCLKNIPPNSRGFTSKTLLSVGFTVLIYYLSSCNGVTKS